MPPAVESINEKVPRTEWKESDFMEQGRVKGNSVSGGADGYKFGGSASADVSPKSLSNTLRSQEPNVEYLNLKKLRFGRRVRYQAISVAKRDAALFSAASLSRRHRMPRIPVAAVGR